MTRTSGPYRAEGDTVWITASPSRRIATTSDTADVSAEQLADLMNRGERHNILLEALEALYSHGKAYAIFSDDIGSAVQDQALAAIAKARGEK